MRFELGQCEVHLWQALPEGAPSAAQEARCLALLDDAERARYRSFAMDRDRWLFLAAHALKRSVLAMCLDARAESLPFCQDAKGRPRLGGAAAASGLDFNLSHARGAALLAVGRGARLGVDVERLDRAVNAQALAERYFAPEEAEDVRGCPPDRRAERFLSYWTLKEACVKARGVGLSSGLGGFWFDVSRPGAPVVNWREPAATGAAGAGAGDVPGALAAWRFWRYKPSEAHVAALAAGWPAPQAMAQTTANGGGAPSQNAVMRAWSVAPWSVAPEPMAIRENA